MAPTHARRPRLAASASFVGSAAVSIITVLTARETKDVATDDLGGLRQRQVSTGAAVEPAVEVR
jgi:hypothetical protein